MANRKGVFIGAYVPNDLKETLRRRAAAEHKSHPAFALAACLIVGFAAGFFFANRANRQELDRLQAEIARVHSAHASSDETKAGNNATTNTEKTSLTDDQLRAVIAKADARPDDHELQRKAGQGLYLYAVQF